MSGQEYFFEVQNPRHTRKGYFHSQTKTKLTSGRIILLLFLSACVILPGRDLIIVVTGSFTTFSDSRITCQVRGCVATTGINWDIKFLL